MYKSKICPICGEQFNPKSARQKYCNKPIIRKCVICGSEYQSNCNQTYSKCCSKKCTTEYAHQQSVASYKDKQVTCVLCGKLFIPKNNTQKICPDRHFKTCCICGKSFEIVWKPGRNIDNIPKTCSTECKTKASFTNGNPFADPDCRERAKQTMLERYGVDHPMRSAEIRDRAEQTNLERYGAKHFVQTDSYITKSITTNRERYGNDWARQNPEIQKKSEDTLYNHYGVTNPMQSDELKSRISETYKSRTGYDHPMQNPEVVEHVKQTNQERYGVEHPLQSAEIRDKVVQTNIDRWGGIGLGSPIIADKVKATNIEKYGFENPASSPKVQARIANTMFTRYGVEHHNASWDYRQTVMTDPTKVDEWKSFISNPESYIDTHFDHKPNYRELENVLGVNDSSIHLHLQRQGKTCLVQHTVSYVENEIIDILQEIKPNIQIERNNRQIIKPYELDIYLPRYHIAIEINPTGTHNSSFTCYGYDLPKPPSYHKMKTNMCEQQGVFLFHIFGYEWSHKKDIILSMLRNLLGCNTQKVYARKCELREVPDKEAFEFLQNNHRQGGVHSKIRYGLYYNDELVSLMTFGKMRNTLGIGNEDLSDCWELVRYCNKLNTSVVGGASKLFQHFIKCYNPDRIRSFSDRAHTKGSLYSILGFTEVRRNSESYVWVNLADNKAYSRVSTQKQHLKSFFKEDDIDLNLTEKQIMESHGYAQVFDSGTITWEWSKSK